MFVDYFIRLVATYITSRWLWYAIYPLFCCYFIASVPGLIRSFSKWR